MCGICGVLNVNSSSLFQNNSASLNLVNKMTSDLKKRGPDSQGHYINESIILGHTRLSILDLSPSGAQPMTIEDIGLVITFNGEIYNYLQLKKELIARGVKNWRGTSDTEVILYVYKEWGLDGLKKLEGIFAFALWDKSNCRLILMRDRLGVKPLFYGKTSNGFSFASEIKAILSSGIVDTSINNQSLSEYLWYGNTHGDRTFFNGINSLEPGHWLIVEKGNFKLEPWWQIEEWVHLPLKYKNEREATDLVKLELDNAVKRQSIADVPIGIFLSGGVDSSSIAASLSHSGLKIDSFAAGFDFDNGNNELAKAASVAKHLGLNHHEFNITGNDLENVIEILAQAHDEPFADAANVPLYLMSKELQGKIKVVMQGDGGDELFAGYRRYSLLLNLDWWNKWPSLLSPPFKKFGAHARRFVRLADSLNQKDSALRMAYLLTVETSDNSPFKIFSSERQIDLINNSDPFLEYRKKAMRFSDFDPVQQMLLTDLTVQLPSQFLPKVDRATMAAGVEARVPLLDEGLLKLVVGMPSFYKVKGVEKKVILRNSQRERLPSTILDGPKKGFNVPYQQWLKSSLFDFTADNILSKSFLNYFSLNEWYIQNLLVQHKNNQRDNGFILWKLLQLSLFQKKN